MLLTYVQQNLHEVTTVSNEPVTCCIKLSRVALTSDCAAEYTGMSSVVLRWTSSAVTS